MHVPAEIAVHTTGHELKNLGALWNYLDQKLGLALVGAIVLARWPPLPYGETGEGPKHPSLAILVKNGVSLTLLDRFIDKLFGFHDATPPMITVEGHSRALMHVTLATMIMYYRDRFDAGEMHSVLHAMRLAYEATMAGATHDTHATFIEWGKLIREQFDLDNLHLTTRSTGDGAQQVVAAVRGLAGNLERLHLTTSDSNERVMAMERSLKAPQPPPPAPPQHNLMDDLRDLASMKMQGLISDDEFTAFKSQLLSGQSVTSAPPAAAATPLATASAPMQRQAGLEYGATTSDVADEQYVAGAPASPAASSSRAPPSAFSALRRDLGGQEQFTTSGKTADAFVLACFANGCNSPAILNKAKRIDTQRMSDAKVVIDAYKAIASPTEKEILKKNKSGDDQERAHAVRIAEELTTILLDCIEAEYVRQNLELKKLRVGTPTFNKILEGIKNCGLEKRYGYLAGRIEEESAALEREFGARDLAFDSKLNGSWRLLYSNGREITSLAVGFPLGFGLGPTFQPVDVDTGRFENQGSVISSLGLARLSTCVIGDVRPAAPGTLNAVGVPNSAGNRVDVDFRRITFSLDEVLGRPVALRKVLVPNLDASAAQPANDITYLDEDMRVVRGGDGALFVFLREPTGRPMLTPAERSALYGDGGVVVTTGTGVPEDSAPPELKRLLR